MLPQLDVATEMGVAFDISQYFRRLLIWSLGNLNPTRRTIFDSYSAFELLTLIMSE